MNEIAISLDEATAHKVEAEAAKAGVSVSRWIGDLVAAQFEMVTASSDARDWLEEPLWESKFEPLPSRFELYEYFYNRPGFRGHQRRDLHQGPARAREGSPVDRMDQAAQG